MEFIFAIIIFSAAVLIRFQILTLLLLGIIAYQLLKNGWRSMIRTSFTYLIAVAIVIGVPYGVAKQFIPEANADGAEQQIIEEVQEWIS